MVIRLLLAAVRTLLGCLVVVAVAVGHTVAVVGHKPAVLPAAAVADRSVVPVAGVGTVAGVVAVRKPVAVAVAVDHKPVAVAVGTVAARKVLALVGSLAPVPVVPALQSAWHCPKLAVAVLLRLFLPWSATA